MNRKKELMASEIHRALQEVLARGLSDPRVRGLVTVTRVELTEDRREATAYVSVMPAEHAALTMHGLRAATNHLRRQTKERVRSRFFPTLAIELDQGLIAQAEVMMALRRVAEDREALGLESGVAGVAGGTGPQGPHDNPGAAPNDEPERPAGGDGHGPPIGPARRQDW